MASAAALDTIEHHENTEISFPKAEEVILHRSGDVLIKNTLLKADHFPGVSLEHVPLQLLAKHTDIGEKLDHVNTSNAHSCVTLFAGCQNKKLSPLLEGAPNFRQVRQDLVFVIKLTSMLMQPHPRTVLIVLPCI